MRKFPSGGEVSSSPEQVKAEIANKRSGQGPSPVLGPAGDRNNFVRRPRLEIIILTWRSHTARSHPQQQEGWDSLQSFC